MEAEILRFLNNLITECLNAEVFASLTEEEKSEKAQELQKHFNHQIFQTLLDNVTQFQLEELEALDFSDPDSGKKIAEITASIPNFAVILQIKLQAESEKIKQTGVFSRNETIEI